MTHSNAMQPFTTIGLLLCSACVMAQDDAAWPSLSGALSVEMEMDHVYHADTPSSELTDGYATVEPEFTLSFSRSWSLNAGLVLEPVTDPVDDRFLEDHGLYVEQIFLQWRGDAASVHIGKINPAFGVAWDQAPGIYGADFAEDYEITEQWGAGATLTLLGEGSATGEVDVTADLFLADTSPLSRSVFTDRGRTRRADGGAGSTSAPRSFSLTLGGRAIPSLPGFGWRASVIRRARGDGDAGSERGAALALTQDITLSDADSVQLMLEGAHIVHQGGSADDASYATAGATYTRGPWNLSLAGSLRRVRPGGGMRVNDRLFQISTGYLFSNGLGIDAGWRFGDEGGEESETLGVLASWSVEF